MLSILAAVALGLLVGSFVDLVGRRVSDGASILPVATGCPGCHRAARPLDHVPVLGWLLRRGRCRHCAATISTRRPLVELGTAALFALLTARFGIDPVLPAYLYLAAVGLTLALIDVEVRRLPDLLTLPSYPVALVLLGAAAAAGSDTGSLGRAVSGGAAMFALYFVLCFAYPAGMGFGDVKLAGVLGLYIAWLGWGAWVVGVFAGFVFGGLFGVVLMLAGRAHRKTAVPFGPFMLLGCLLAILAGERVAKAYVSLSGG